jgi:hypothetical protein
MDGIWESNRGTARTFWYTHIVQILIFYYILLAHHIGPVNGKMVGNNSHLSTSESLMGHLRCCWSTQKLASSNKKQQNDSESDQLTLACLPPSSTLFPQAPRKWLKDITGPFTGLKGNMERENLENCSVHQARLVLSASAVVTSDIQFSRGGKCGQGHSPPKLLSIMHMCPGQPQPWHRRLWEHKMSRLFLHNPSFLHITFLHKSQQY